MTTPAPTPAEPTSASAVATWLQNEHGETADTGLAERLGPTVAAVNRLVRRLHNPLPDGSWDADIALGAQMQAARLWRRRKSPEGVMAQFAVEGPVYIQRNDPDVAMLLQLGAWARPVVG